MAKRLQLRRGTTTEHSTFTGAVGEVTVDTDKDAVVVHDGATAGGVPAATEASVTTHTTDTDNPHSVTYTQVGADAAGTAASEASAAVTTHETTYDHDAFLSDSDIGVTVEAYDSTILKDADIGVNVQAYDADIVSDASYVHTDNNYTTTEKTKLSGIAEGAEVNVNADWDASSGDAQILNKPTTVAGYGITDAYTETEVDNLLADKIDKVTSTNNAVARYDGTTGAVKNSTVTVDDSGNIEVPANAHAASISMGVEGSTDGFLNTPESLYINIDSDNTDTTKIVQIGRDTTGQSTEPIAIFRENGDFILHDDTGASELVLWDASEEKLTVTGDIDAGNVTLTGYLAGPATFTIDPSAVGDNTGTVVIAGNLQVDGTTTTVNSQTLDVADLNITVASGATTAAEANGAGLTVAGATAKLLYGSTNDDFTFNKSLVVEGDIDFTGTLNDITTTELGYLDGVTSAIQTQLDGKVVAQTSTDNAIVRFDGTTGQVQDTPLTITDDGLIEVFAVDTNHTDLDAIGANPTATLWSDGTITGSTDNGSYTKYPNGDVEISIKFNIAEAGSAGTFGAEIQKSYPIAITTTDNTSLNIFCAGAGDGGSGSVEAITFSTVYGRFGETSLRFKPYYHTDKTVSGYPTTVSIYLKGKW